jgi:very-short-patch-repair endonuclease
MGYQGAQPSEIWRLVARQHGVISRAQLLERGIGSQAIKRRRARGRLHPVHRGVYAVGRPELSRRGRLMAAVLACGPGAVISHWTAAELWGIVAARPGEIDVSVPAPRSPRCVGVRVHRRRAVAASDVAAESSIPVTALVRTFVDLAASGVSPAILERAVNEADRLERIDPDELRAALDRHPGEQGVGRLRSLLDRSTFTLTESELERAFLPIARAAGLPQPLTQQRVNGFRVDFFWPELALVVETDGLTYHRTPTQQARDRLRDQAHAAAGMTPLRFTRAQVRFDPARVEATLAAVARRITSLG